MNVHALHEDFEGEPSALGRHLFDPIQESLHEPLEELRAIQRQRALEGLPIWDLSMVNPDLAPPRPVLDRLLESVTKSTNHRYAVSRGVRRLREGFAIKYANRFGVSLDPETDVCVCLGAKDATFHALRVLAPPGSSVVVASPSYPNHLSAVALVGAVSIMWEVSGDPEVAERSLDSLLQRSRARVLLVNFPSNPTGATVTEEWWSRIGAVCRHHNVTIVNDFVYGEMTFSGKPAVSVLQVADVGARCVEVYSLSKAYNVPGWRVGALVGDSEVIAAVSRVKSLADYGLFLPLQYAATVALTSQEDLVRPTVKVYERRLKVLSIGLEQAGWRVFQPQAGACLWAQYPRQFLGTHEVAGAQSIRVAQKILQSVGIGITPGVVFGQAYDDCVRFAAVTSEERLREVVSMISKIS